MTLIELFCVFRLLQNRESAKKCRIKKKANFEIIHREVESLKTDKKEMLEKINELTLLLYSKVDERYGAKHQFTGSKPGVEWDK